ncbi:MAG: glycogen/starch/alpha-glucan phosphorylase, partial [Candidatus Omnitrophota bacterium]|nr:glycogen/starch/alpha-glucan phosphorylase [Candidatus Omnitrophota bacterium]
MLLEDINKLLDFTKRIGPIQIIFAGKAHPQDNLGFVYINDMLDKIDKLAKVHDSLKIIMLENYDIFLAKKLVSGVDVWLNNPLPPFEASGTSGMKAILNGVLQLSTLDGWMVEAEDKNIGRIFGYRAPEKHLGDEYNLRIQEDSRQLYIALEEILALYYQANKVGRMDISSAWIDMMIDCLVCASHFNTYRMLDEYKRDIWKIP